MKKSILFLLILPMFLISSCFYIRVDYPQEREWAPVDEFHKIVPLSPGGTLSLANMNGNVEIHGWEQEELEVYAEKMIREGFAPGIIFDRFENFIKIRTKNASADKEASLVDFYIDAPHSINLKDIVVSNGNILISEVFGEAYLDLKEGDITVENFSGSLRA